MASHHRKLTQEEANKLFETTFLLISQQNLAEKQKYLKNKSAPHAQTLDLSPLSPRKSNILQSKHQSPDLMPLSSLVDPENLIEKVMQNTSHKFSTDKQQSCNEVNEPSLQSQFKNLEREQNSLDFQDQVMLTPKKLEKISDEMQAESQQKQSQINHDTASDLYLESYIKEIKRDLQISSRGKICKSQEINSKTGQVTGYNFYCKNVSNCPFDCSLIYTGERNTKNQKLYKLVAKCENHLKVCIEDEQEITFMKLTKVIDDMEQYILHLISQNMQLKPKEILVTMAERMGQSSHKFIYKGLVSKSYHKAAKKYFDNLIYKVKSQLGAF